MHVKITMIQLVCQQQQQMTIGLRDSQYEQAASITYNQSIANDNEKLIQVQKALLPLRRELGNKITDNETYNKLVTEGKVEAQRRLKTPEGMKFINDILDNNKTEKYHLQKI